jgi:DNA (cytosine-5)-methyltransferase 1
VGPEKGDITKIDWQKSISPIDIIHGGPPCQPFSIAGQQAGESDDRNMWGEFIRTVNTIKPKSFVAENVLGLLNPKFRGFVQQQLLDKLSDYHIHLFELNAADFGIPQQRRRVFLVGFRSKAGFLTTSKGHAPLTAGLISRLKRALIAPMTYLRRH